MAPSDAGGLLARLRAICLALRASGWVGLVLDTNPDWTQVAWLVEQAFRLVAAKRLVGKLPPRAG